jgi:hypothetical protein
MMNQQTLHSPTVETSPSCTLKRSRTSILRSNEPLFLLEGSYWPRVLVSDSAGKRRSKQRTSLICSSANRSVITKVARRGIKGSQNRANDKRIHKAWIRRLRQSSKKSADQVPTLSMPLLPSLVDLPALLEEQHQQFRWRPAPLGRSCSSLTGKAWPVGTASGEKMSLEEQRQPLESPQFVGPRNAVDAGRDSL